VKSVFILKDQIDQIWGVYSSRAGADQHRDEAMSQMDDDNYQELFVNEWVLDVAWGDVRGD
jgi:hypothetical protein